MRETPCSKGVDPIWKWHAAGETVVTFLNMTLFYSCREKLLKYFTLTEQYASTVPGELC